MKKLMMIAVAALSCVALSAGKPAGVPSMNARVAEKIGLSAEVQQQIKQIEQDSRKAIKELQLKTRDAMEKQARLMTEVKPDEAAVMAAIDELFDLRKEMAKTQTKRILAVKALLTTEQLEKALEEMKKAREEHRAKKDGAPKGARRGKAKDGQTPPADQASSVEAK